LRRLQTDYIDLYYMHGADPFAPLEETMRTLNDLCSEQSITYSWMKEGYMKYRYMGRTGLLVSRVCLGTMTFGAKDWGCDRKASMQLIDNYLNAGGNFIDTADIYAGSASEEIVGEALRDKKRDEIVLATKCFFRTGKSPNAKGFASSADGLY